MSRRIWSEWNGTRSPTRMGWASNLMRWDTPTAMKPEGWDIPSGMEWARSPEAWDVPTGLEWESGWEGPTGREQDQWSEMHSPEWNGQENQLGGMRPPE